MLSNKMYNEVYNTKSYWFVRVDVATGAIQDRRLLTHWEASDKNHYLARDNDNHRWLLAPAK